MSEQRAVSRREFLKLAGVAGATIGVGAGLGGLIAACGGSEETTTPAGAASTTSTAAAGGTGTTAGASTTVSASAESGRDLKIGIISPKTGNLASFALADDWYVGWLTLRWRTASSAATGRST